MDSEYRSLRGRSGMKLAASLLWYQIWPLFTCLYRPQFPIHSLHPCGSNYPHSLLIPPIFHLATPLGFHPSMPRTHVPYFWQYIWWLVQCSLMGLLRLRFSTHIWRGWLLAFAVPNVTPPISGQCVNVELLWIIYLPKLFHNLFAPNGWVRGAKIPKKYWRNQDYALPLADVLHFCLRVFVIHKFHSSSLASLFLYICWLL